MVNSSNLSPKNKPEVEDFEVVSSQTSEEKPSETAIMETPNDVTTENNEEVTPDAIIDGAKNLRITSPEPEGQDPEQNQDQDQDQDQGRDLPPHSRGHHGHHGRRHRGSSGPRGFMPPPPDFDFEGYHGRPGDFYGDMRPPHHHGHCGPRGFMPPPEFFADFEGDRPPPHHRGHRGPRGFMPPPEFFADFEGDRPPSPPRGPPGFPADFDDMPPRHRGHRGPRGFMPPLEFFAGFEGDRPPPRGPPGFSADFDDMPPPRHRGHRGPRGFMPPPKPLAHFEGDRPPPPPRGPCGFMPPPEFADFEGERPPPPPRGSPWFSADFDDMPPPRRRGHRGPRGFMPPPEFFGDFEGDRPPPPPRGSPWFSGNPLYFENRRGHSTRGFMPHPPHPGMSRLSPPPFGPESIEHGFGPFGPGISRKYGKSDIQFKGFGPEFHHKNHHHRSHSPPGWEDFKAESGPEGHVKPMRGHGPGPRHRYHGPGDFDGPRGFAGPRGPRHYRFADERQHDKSDTEFDSMSDTGSDTSCSSCDDPKFDRFPHHPPGPMHGPSFGGHGRGMPPRFGMGGPRGMGRRGPFPTHREFKGAKSDPFPLPGHFSPFRGSHKQGLGGRGPEQCFGHHTCGCGPKDDFRPRPNVEESGPLASKDEDRHGNRRHHEHRPRPEHNHEAACVSAEAM